MPSSMNGHGGHRPVPDFREEPKVSVDLQLLEGLDTCWIALDVQGKVGAFVTAGSGPIPKTALPWLEHTEEQAMELPVSSTFEMLVPYTRPDDFLELARRGIYAFDWTDIQKTTSGATGMYELVCRPNQPITVEQLPLALQSAAKATQIVADFLNSPVKVANLDVIQSDGTESASA